MWSVSDNHNMSSLALLIFSILISFAHALPIDETQPATPICDDITRCRTKSNIIRSCLITILSCTWVAMHPNIPAPDDECLARTFHRLKLMMVAIVAPELIVVWATRQWFMSRHLAKEHKKHHWTQTHGFFALMGGFMRRSSGQSEPYKTLYPVKPTWAPAEEAERTYASAEEADPPAAFTLDALSDQDFPKITEEEIEDKSKGDALSKGIAIVQTGWFVIQCIERRRRHLPTTELEIVTVAFATMSIVTYVLWWNKPLTVDLPHLVGGEEEWGFKPVRFRENVKRIFITIGQVLNDGIKIGRDVLRGRYMWKDAVKAIRYPLKLSYALIAGYDRDEDVNDDWRKRVPAFYSGQLDETERTEVKYFSIIITLIFGAIHCVAWNCPFVTRSEQMLWRVAAVAMVGLPLFLVKVAFRKIQVESPSRIRVIATCLYVLARLILFILAFTSLRALPLEAYQTVAWTSYIPHM